MIAMVAWIGLFIGLAFLAAGAFVLIALVRMLAEGRVAALLLVGMGMAIGFLALIGSLVSLGRPMHAEFEPQDAWAHEGYGPEDWHEAHRVAPPAPMPPISSPMRSVKVTPTSTEVTFGPPGNGSTVVTVTPPASSVPTSKIQAEATKIQAEVTKLDPNDPLIAAPSTVPAGEIAPGTTVPEVIAGPRPDWIDRGPEWIEGDYRVVLHSGLFPSVMDSGNDLGDRARKALSEYYAREYGAQDGSLTPDVELDRMINAQVLRERYIEPVESDVLERTMYRQHGLLVISPELRGKLDSIWRKQLVDRRLTSTGQSAGGVLAALIGLWGVLKLTGRRQPKPVMV
jgi:hypothetical protein